jgi:Ca2+-binding RTX toxin-like protein
VKAPAGVKAVVLALACALLTLGAAAPGKTGGAAQEEEPRCHGRHPGIVGTDGPDVLRGTPSRDVIWGGLGDDTIIGSLGNDLLCGGPGADLIHGGRGNDVADGGAGAGDIVIGDLGDDHLLGGPGNADEVAGSLGIDVLSGGAGSFDLVHGDYGYDRMDGGSGGGDIASFATDVSSAKGAGVHASLAAHRARGDGHDRLFRFESLEGSAFRDVLIGDKRANVIDGGPGDDTIRGGPHDQLIGGQGTDKCHGGKGRTTSCGREAPPKGSAFVELDDASGGGGGLAIIGGAGDDELAVSLYDKPTTFVVTAAKGIALGAGCTRLSSDLKQAVCPVNGPARWLMADLGPGNDRLQVEGSLVGAQNVRISGGSGNDVIHGGDEDDLIEAGSGADRLYGGAGSDGLIGGLPGPTFLYGGKHGDLLAAGGGCAGGAIVGGPGRDDASFAETQAHPGILYISFPLNKAWIDAVPNCKPVRLDDSDEDMEGSFDYDVLIGDSAKNSMLGQPGVDRFYGNGGDDVIDARDGVRDEVIQCGRGRTIFPKGKKGSHPPPKIVGTPAGRAFTDSFDPVPILCAEEKHGTPVPGLNNKG